jgi:hypothetical protein
MFHAQRFLVATVVICALGASALAQRSPDILPLRLTANAVGTGGALTGPVAGQLDITVTRWSTAGETERLIATLKQKGPEALLEAVRDARSVGRIGTPGNLAYDLRYASQEMLDDGMRRIVLITDRPMSIWETVNRPRTFDYPFTLIELRLNRDGEGEGKLNLATSIDASRSGKYVQLENYDTQPIHLNNIRPVR